MTVERICFPDQRGQGLRMAGGRREILPVLVERAWKTN